MEEEAFAATILRRAPVGAALEPDRIAGRRLLVTGAGGYIGGGLAQLAADLGAAHVTLVDNSERGLYSIDDAIAEAHPRLSRRAVYCDVRERIAIERCMVAERPDVVLHAAALKQLPLVEAHVREGFLTNTVGALNVAAAAATAGVHAVILISTDKAAQPSSALGATKGLAEQLFQEMDRCCGRTRFASVRFGNVFGSTGSVVPRFRRQIARGGPVTLTHPEMTRFFITRDEACRLVLSALSLTVGTPERGDLYALDAGEPLSILELARRLIAQDAPGKLIPIAIVGPRPGERFTENLLRPEERALATALPGVIRIRSAFPATPVLRQPIEDLAAAALAGDELQLHVGLAQLVPEFGGAFDPWERRVADRA